MSGKHYSPFSNHDFGDPRCGVDPRDIDRTQDDSSKVRRFEAFPPLPGPDRVLDMPKDRPDQSHLLSFAEAKAAGEAMHDHWVEAHEQDEEVPAPPFLRIDAGWADLARAAWEAVWQQRR